MIHSGEGGSQWGIDKEEFMERLTESSKATADHFGNHIAYINVLRNMSVSCDCEGTGAQPVVTPNIGILASTDILAADQASVDLVYALPEKDRHALVERMESRHGLRQLSYMKELGHGLRPVCAAGPGPWQPAPDPGGCGEGRKTLRGIKNS